MLITDLSSDLTLSAPDKSRSTVKKVGFSLESTLLQKKALISGEKHGSSNPFIYRHTQWKKD